MDSEKIENNNKINFNFRLILAIVIGLFLLFSHWIFVNYFERMGRPVKKIFPIDLSQGKFSHYGIESLSLYKEKNYLYNLSGWAFSVSNITESTDLYRTEIVLFNETKNFFFDAIPQWREDVATAYTNILIGDTGFHVLINKILVPLDSFCIGVLFSSKENNDQYFLITNWVVQNKLFKLDLVFQEDSYCESLYEKNIKP